MPNLLTVAAAHLAPVYMDPGKTAAKAAEWIGRAGKAGETPGSGPSSDLKRIPHGSAQGRPDSWTGNQGAHPPLAAATIPATTVKLTREGE